MSVESHTVSRGRPRRIPINEEQHTRSQKTREGLRVKIPPGPPQTLSGPFSSRQNLSSLCSGNSRESAATVIRTQLNARPLQFLEGSADHRALGRQRVLCNDELQGMKRFSCLEVVVRGVGFAHQLANTIAKVDRVKYRGDPARGRSAWTR